MNYFYLREGGGGVKDGSLLLFRFGVWFGNSIWYQK
jgi:hypothetical protein